MGDNTLTTIAEPATVEVADMNQYFTALAGDSIPRNTSTGAPEDNVHKLGRPAFRWKEAHVTDLFLGGSLFDPNALGADTKFAINKGATRTDSGQPDFLRADGTGASAKILAAATDFQITANNTSVTLTADVAITSLTVAPSANNTALVDDSALAGGDETKFTGEDVGDPITIDTVGSEITDRIGEFICLKTPTGEFMFAFVEDATTLSRCFRGFFFDDNGDPVVRGVLSNNDTLTIMSLGWVFLDKNGTTVDVSYTSPIYSGVEPSSPVTDDYWFDLKNRLWKRFDGSVFVSVDRMLIGLLVIDATNAVAGRSFDFTKSYDDFADLEIELQSNTEVKTKKGYSRISVYGQTQELYAGEFLWDITADLETGVSETADTYFYIYLTEEGIPKISDERPFNRLSELKAFYHPYHSWRNIGRVFNDGGSNFDFIRPINENPKAPILSVNISGSPQTIEFEDIFKKDHSYRIDFNGVEFSGNSEFLMQVGESGNTFKADSTYNYTSFGVGNGGLVTNKATTDGNFVMTCAQVDSGNETLNGSIWINNPRDATQFFNYRGILSYREVLNHHATCTTSGEYRGSTVGMGSIKFDLQAAGTFESGVISVYEYPIS